MQTRSNGRWIVFWLILVLLGTFVLYRLFFPKTGAAPGMRPQELAPVRVAKAYTQDVPHFLNGLGTVLPSSDVLVKSRVSGQLMNIHFQEGQQVKRGDLLAEIDPRPFKAALAEAEGKLSADLAQLNNARRDLKRYASLVKGDFVERQKYDAQQALVGQYEGAVAADKAACENARLQLEYSRITAPAGGITGLRKVDAGNQIQANDSEGLVRITEVSPCDVLFTLPETTIPLLIQNMNLPGKAPLAVQAWDREQKNLLSVGSLVSLDNEIDKNTGTVRLKARFDNSDRSLYPQQFVNARIRVQTLKGVVTVPAAAIQLGSKGSYVYVLHKEEGENLPLPAERGRAGAGPTRKGGQGRVEMRLVTTGLETPRFVVVTEGVKAGEMVVVDGVDRLKDGAMARISGEVETPRLEPSS